MEKLRSLVKVMEGYGEAVGQVKNVISGIEEKIQLQKNNLASFLENNQTASFELEMNESELDDKLRQIQKKIQTLEKLKQSNNNSGLNRGFVGNSSSTAMQFTSFNSSASDNKEESSSFEKNFKVTSSSSPNPVADDHNRSTSEILVPSSLEWWQKDVPKKQEVFDINWVKESSERKVMKLCLAVQSGWNEKLTSFNDLEAALRRWTGPGIYWTVEKTSRSNLGNAPVIYVKFKTFDDLEKVMDMWEDSDEFQGTLQIVKAMTDIEKKERSRLLWMSRQLKADGHQVVHEDERIRVDGQWWKYCFREGWLKA